MLDVISSRWETGWQLDMTTLDLDTCDDPKVLRPYVAAIKGQSDDIYKAAFMRLVSLDAKTSTKAEDPGFGR